MTVPAALRAAAGTVIVGCSDNSSRRLDRLVNESVAPCSLGSHVDDGVGDGSDLFLRGVHAEEMEREGKGVGQVIIVLDAPAAE